LNQESLKADEVKIDNYGRVSITEKEAFDAVYTGKLSTLEGIIIDGPIDQYNRARLQNADRIPVLELPEDLSEVNKEFFDESNQCDWFMPEECSKFPIVDWLYDQCKTKEELARVDEELLLFIQHGMFDLLFYLKYLVDTMRQNNIVWGVGRGSSVASFVLFLLGIHRINSLYYDLSIDEFLK
jgi:DNA polymerase III alpha subunit